MTKMLRNSFTQPTTLFKNVVETSVFNVGWKKTLSLNSCEGYIPVKMAFNSYETTNINFDNLSPLIIMHGLFGSKNNWNSISKVLHNKIKKKIIVVDARNHGDSPHSEEFSYQHLSADIAHLMRELGIAKASLLGHSMGGRAMMTFALSYPKLVESIIVVDISPVNSSSGMMKMSTYFDALKSVQLKSNLTMSQARKAADGQLTHWVPDFAVRQFLLTNLTQEEGGLFKWRVNLNALSRSFENEIMNFPRISSVCKKPALFLGGLRSDYLRFEDHDTIQQLFPLAKFQYIDAGHWLHSEKPAEFIKTISDFLSRKKLKV